MLAFKNKLKKKNSFQNKKKMKPTQSQATTPYSTVFPYFYSDPTKPGYVSPNQNNPNQRFGVFYPNAFIPSMLQSTYTCDAYVPPSCQPVDCFMQREKNLYDRMNRMGGK